MPYYSHTPFSQEGMERTQNTVGSSSFSSTSRCPCRCLITVPGGRQSYSSQLEEEFEAGREKEQTLPVDRKKSTTPKKGLKNLVKSCVTRKKREDND
ncbi:hypothetical protein OROHE_004727 [Orobanche hederae]